MKKGKIVLPTLLATSGLPLVSLVGCQNGGEDQINFHVHDPIYTQEGGTQIPLFITGTPACYIDFSNTTFSYYSGTVTTTNFSQISSKQDSATFFIYPTTALVKGIEDGVLSFHYIERENGFEGDVVGKNIKVIIPSK